MAQTLTTTSPKRRAKFLVGGAIIVVTLVALIGWAMNRPGSTAFYQTVTEVKALGPAAAAEDYRVNGNVVPGSLERNGIETSFEITDGNEELRVVTQEALPDAFWTGYDNDPDSVEIVAQGRYDGETFGASQVLAKCPSKFKAQA